jgi:5-methylcytosine-specific restriction protein B
MRISDSNLTDLYEAKVSSDTKPFSSTGSLLADFRAEIEVSGFTFSKSIIDRFVCALLTKPFVILTGLSGSGKTKLAHSFAKWICTSEKQYCLIPVGADWTSREPLLGFPDALQMDKYVYPDNGVLELLIRANKEEHEDEPHFLILDEMNLSHVERYFADFLSAMESKEKIPLHSKKEIKDVNRSILLPPNLFIIGTVNIDETTYMFSPKVLDRSNVIEFRIAQDEIDGFLDNYGNSQGQITIGKGAMMAQDFVERAGKLDYDYANKSVSDVLKLFFKELKKAGAEFGYRSGGEILRWAAIAKSLDNDWKDHDIIDAAIMQKLLPKLHGSQKKLSPVLTKLMTLCLRSKNSAAAETIFKKTELAESDFVEVIYPLSFEKLHRMYRNAVNNSFTSYAEA